MEPLIPFTLINTFTNLEEGEEFLKSNSERFLFLCEHDGKKNNIITDSIKLKEKERK
jgi:hypothetical protein